jgi:hypothetical protein
MYLWFQAFTADVTQIISLLGYYTVYDNKYAPKFRRIVLPPSSEGLNWFRWMLK